MTKTLPHRAARGRRTQSDEDYLRRVLDRAGVPHRRGLRGTLRYAILIAIPTGLASLRPEAPSRQNRFAAIGVGALSAIGAALALLWNQLILSCIFGAVGVTNVVSLNSMSNSSNGTERPRH